MTVYVILFFKLIVVAPVAAQDKVPAENPEVPANVVAAPVPIVNVPVAVSKEFRVYVFPVVFVRVMLFQLIPLVSSVLLAVKFKVDEVVVTVPVV